MTFRRLFIASLEHVSLLLDGPNSVTFEIANVSSRTGKILQPWLSLVIFGLEDSLPPLQVVRFDLAGETAISFDPTIVSDEHVYPVECLFSLLDSNRAVKLLLDLLLGIIVDHVERAQDSAAKQQ